MALDLVAVDGWLAIDRSLQARIAHTVIGKIRKTFEQLEHKRIACGYEFSSYPLALGFTKYFLTADAG